jgi:hypothetical protein
MFTLKSLTVLTFAVSAFAIPSFLSKNVILQKRERDWTGWSATIYVPTGKDDVGYQQSSDNGTTWKSDPKTSRLQSVQTIGYRVKGQPETEFIARVRFPPSHGRINQLMQ